jgi:hypothetical protein
LINGLENNIEEISITGGMCGDDARFEKTPLIKKTLKKEK